jgi:hypothetical protein
MGSFCGADCGAEAEKLTSFLWPGALKSDHEEWSVPTERLMGTYGEI